MNPKVEAPVVPINNEVANVNAVNDVPAGTIVNYGDTSLTDPVEQADAIRKYIRAKVLAQYGVVGINRETVSQLPIGFNGQNVQTRLKLPKVQTNLAGEFCEPLETYYKRVLPQIRIWFKNCLFNASITMEQIGAMK